MNVQQKTVLALLQLAGEAGISSYDLTYSHAIKEVPTQIKELREMGHTILSQAMPNRTVQYILVKELPPLQATTRPKTKPKKEYFTWKIEDMEYDKANNIWRHK